MIGMIFILLDRTYQSHIFLIVADSSGPQFSDFSTPSDTYFNEQLHDQVEIDVVDEDGVDTVWMQYRLENETTWANSYLENNPPYLNSTYIGIFEATLKPGYNSFSFQFFANDTLGNLSESEVYEWTVYYMREEGPTPLLDYLIPALVISSVILVLIGFGYWLYKKRQ